MQILTSLNTEQTKPRKALTTSLSAREVQPEIALSGDSSQLSASARPVAQSEARPTAQPEARAVADPDQARRISKFVRESKESGARNLRGVMGMMAGQLTGMTVGSLIFAPLAFHYGNLYIATGGAALTGAALAFVGHKLASREVTPGSGNSGWANAGVAVGALANSLPKFAYPTLAGATAHEKAVVYSALDKLPLSGVTSVPTINMVTGLEKAGASGLATPLFSHSRIFLDRDQMALGDDWAREVTTHEVGHTFDFSKGVGPIGNRSHRGGGFGKAPFISDYANTNRMEDYAESYANFHRNPTELLRTAPRKYQAVAASQQPGLVDQALDRPSVRDAGRRVGTAFERAPWLRNALALGSALVSPFQIYRGATNLERGLKFDDKQALFDGKMQLASGSALFLSGTAPLGLALTVGHMVAGKMLADGTITPEQANAFADKSLAVSTGPVGFVAGSIEKELDKAGLLEEKGTIELFNSKGRSKAFDAGTGTALAGGFALGAAAGGILTPLLVGGSAASMISSAAGGTWVGGLAGAALGFGAHFLAAKMKESPQPFGLLTQDDKLTDADKKLLAKLAAPTIVAGVGGAVLGGMAGDYLGSALGSAVAGAAGGVTGAAVGRYLGIMGGSFALVKGGAKLGAAWAGLPRASAPVSAASSAQV